MVGFQRLIQLRRAPTTKAIWSWTGPGGIGGAPARAERICSFYAVLCADAVVRTVWAPSGGTVSRAGAT